MARSVLAVIIITSATGLGGQTSSSQIGKEISITPIVFGIHRTEAGTWHPDKQPVSFVGWGLRGAATHSRWQIEAELILMRFFGLQQIPNRFSPEQGFNWQQHATGKLEEFDTDYSNFELTYQNKGLTAFLGKLSPKWGPALHSIVVSQKAPTYPQFGFEWQINEQLHFYYFHGELFSGMRDNSHSSLDSSLFGDRTIYFDRYIAAHRLEWNIVASVTLGLSESVVYGGRGIETIYLLPFMSLWSAQHYLGDTDNVQMSADLTWRFGDYLNVYGVFFMDEWQPQSTFREDNHNWFGWQVGFNGRSVFIADDLLLLEGTWTDHRIYRHKYPVNDYYHHGYPMGHWSGPHAQSLFMAYVLPYREARFMASYLYSKRGELLTEMIEDQYQEQPYRRFTGETETLQTLDVTMGRELFSRLWLELGVSRVMWHNAGFNPAEPEAGELQNINKTSLTLGFYYNFSLPGYHITMLQSQ